MIILKITCIARRIVPITSDYIIIMERELNILKKYKIGVLAGGPSSEREISLASGRAVFDALQEHRLQVIFIDVKEHNLSSCLDQAKIDIAFIALHGRFGEDGTIQKMLDQKNIPYTGSNPESSRLAFDKLASKKRFKEVGLRTPEYKLLGKAEDATSLNVPIPCAIKPRNEGSSIGVSIVSSKGQTQKAIDKAFEFSEEIIIERFASGREITVGILEDKPLPVVEIVTPSGVYDFDSKYTSDDTEYIVPAKLSKGDYWHAQEIALKAHNALGCKSFSRVDLRLSETGEIFILEVNTIPGLTRRSLLPMAAKAQGLDFIQVCVKMLSGALQKSNGVR